MLPTAALLPLSIPSPSRSVWYLGPFPLRAYALCILAGVFIAVWWTSRRYRARGGDGDTVLDAAALGVPVRRVQIVLLLTAALVTAVMVSVAGAIGFVGLVIPHVARLLVGVRHSRLLPASALLGAVFLVAADVVSRILIAGQVLPIGVITSLVGAPIFALMLLRQRQGGRS